MPILAAHHAYKDKDHQPSQDWPPDCMVQWGGHGVVVKQGGGGYRTAFFEAFPQGGGFFRGEGASIEEAEADCLKRYQAFLTCPEHRWSRGKYLNGGGICRHCKTFRSVFQPVVALGDWKKPLNASALGLLADGAMRPDPEDASSHRYRRRTWLKARAIGIKLPDFDTAPPEPDGFEPDAYATASRKAVAAYLIDHLNEIKTDTNGVSGIFGALHMNILRGLVEEVTHEDNEGA